MAFLLAFLLLYFRNYLVYTSSLILVWIRFSIHFNANVTIEKKNKTKQRE